MSKNKEFLQYYDLFKDKIYNYFWYRLNFNDALAEDLTSEIFIKAFKAYDSFDTNRSFQAWIYRIAKNHLSNYYRTAGREVSIECAVDLDCEILTQIDASLELESVIEEMNKLSNYQRDVLLMRFVQGLTNSEIAEVMNKDERAIRTQISRALTDSRDMINKRI